MSVAETIPTSLISASSAYLPTNRGFFTQLSHQIRAPMSAIMGWACMLKREELDAAQCAEGYETIIQQTKALSKIMDGLLDFGRIMTGELKIDCQPVDLNSALQQAVEAIQPAADAAGLLLDYDLERSGLMVCGDRDRLEQVFWHLLDNAVRYTPAGGAIRICEESDGQTVKISIIDTGLGFATGAVPKVFDMRCPAWCQKSINTTGLGLGLTVTERLVRLHHGSLEITSAGENLGSTVSVSLPILASSEPLAATAVDLTGLKILVVDDDPDTLALLTIMLSKAGGMVFTASSSAEAVRQAAKHEFHLLLSDIGMPGGDGFHLLRKLRQSDFTQPAIALTNYTAPEHRRAALRAGFQEHIPKPFLAGELCQVIAQVMRRLPFHSSIVALIYLALFSTADCQALFTDTQSWLC